ncbi:MAG: helix-turn-helix domain-containing protein [Bacteroidota bacterium]|nr:helix-turn-helix domain-containing protein [Bacteroidota bacterium]
MLPEVKYFSPGADASWVVKKFEFIRYDSPNVLTDKFVPREDAAIVFHFRNRPQMLAPAKLTLPPFFVAPVIPSANSISLTGQNDTMIVICRPTVLSRVLGVRLAAGSYSWVPLPEMLFGRVWAAMREEDEPETRMELFSGFINGLCPAGYVPDETDRSYDLMIRKGIGTQLPDIIKELGVSERTLQRRFRDRLGTSPKMLIRIMRINYLWGITSSGGKIDYHDLVFLGNYFDQNHLIKDFKSITGETPDTFFRRNLCVARIFSGK